LTEDIDINKNFILYQSFQCFLEKASKINYLGQKPPLFGLNDKLLMNKKTESKMSKLLLYL